MKERRRTRPAAAPAPRALFQPEPPPRPPRPLRDLMVLTSDEDLVRWNRTRVAEVLVREAGLDGKLADEISRGIETSLLRGNLQAIPTTLLRELVGAELLVRGLTSEWTRHTRLGVSLYDVGRLLRGGEDSSACGAPLDPETTSLLLARRIKRDYALAAVFSERVAEAHRQGALHLHGLDAIDRPRSVCLTLAGMERSKAAAAGAAAPAEVDGFVGRLAAAVAALADYHAAEVVLEGLNLTLAPYYRGPDGDDRPGGRTLTAAAAAQFLARLRRGGVRRQAGGGASVTPALVWDLPEALTAQPLAGPGGRPAGTAGEHEEAARRVALAVVEAVLEWKGSEAAPAPDLILLIGPAFFRTPGHLDLLERAAEAARRHGSLRFRFLRPGPPPAASRGRRRRALVADPSALPTRDGELGAVSLNLPRLGYLAGGSEEALADRLRLLVDLAARAHVDRRVFLEELMARGRQGPLALLADRSEGPPLLDLEQAVHAVNVCGLNELAEIAVGHPLHGDGAAAGFAERILTLVARQVEAAARRCRLRLVAGAAPDPAAAERFAKLDLRYHSPVAGHHVKGEIRTGQVSYTPGAGLAAAAPLRAAERIEREGVLQARVAWQACTRVPATALGASPRTAAALIMAAYGRSECRELQVVRAARPPARG